MLSCSGSAPCDPSVNMTNSCGSHASYVFFPLFFLVGVILVSTCGT